MSDHTWVKPSASSTSSGDDCVEVRITADAVFVRDSKNRRHSLRFSRSPWTAFLALTADEDLLALTAC